MTGTDAPKGPSADAPATPTARAESGGREASATLAALLSLLFPGLGHIYARQTFRGLCWILGAWLLSISLVVLLRANANAFVVVLPLLVCGAAGIWVGTTVDAVRILRRHRGPALSNLKTVFAGLLIFAFGQAHSRLLRTWVVEAFKMPSGSMIPTLLVADHFLVDKVRSPARGDLLVFPYPEHPTQEFIKRVVGLPGDRLTFRDGHPIINGIEVPSCYVGTASYKDCDSPVTEHRGKVYLETLGDRRHLTFYDDAMEGSRRYEGPYVVEPGEVFVIGDNRDNSHDSRMWYGGRGGGVPIATHHGVPFVVWLSSDDKGAADWSRFGLDLEKPHLPESMASLEQGFDRCLAERAGYIASRLDP